MTLWHTAIHYDRSKVNPWIGARNALGVAIPLVIGAAVGQMSGGLLVAVGALNVSYSDGPYPYGQRARRLLAASCWGALAVGAGGLLGREHLLLITLAGVAAFAAGMMVGVSQTAADIGGMALAALIVFAAQAMTPIAALYSTLLAFGGGLLQTALALSFWSVRRYLPERRALAVLFAELARAAANPQESADHDSPPPASAESTGAQSALSDLSGDHSIEAERYLALLNQAERIRLSLLAIGRLRNRIQREPNTQAQTAILERSLGVASHLLAVIGRCIETSDREPSNLEAVHQLETGGEELRRSPEPMARDARWQLDALAGQLRSAADLAFHTTTAGSADFEARESSNPWALRLSSDVAKVRANLTFSSTAFRHALRLGVCVALGEAINRIIGSHRGYWLPMTVSIVLRPDFSATFSRGAMRVVGTLAGLVVATGIVHFISPGPPFEIFLIVFFTFLLRTYGPANYGIFVTALTALVVFLVSVTGVAPGPVMLARGVNTLAGGVIALIAYALWPTWEHRLTHDRLAEMLDAYRRYFDAVRDAYLKAETEAHLDDVRQSARLARSNAEASIGRLSGEPGVTNAQLTKFNRILATTHRFIHAVMSLEAGLASSAPAPPRDAFRKLANDVDVTLGHLSTTLRGAEVMSNELSDQLPDLREDHHALLQAANPKTGRYALVNIETDRIVNSLNTLRGML